MSEARGRLTPLPSLLPAASPMALEVPERALVDVLAAAAAAMSASALADAVLDRLVQLDGVRAAALARTQVGGVMVIGAVGYDCAEFRAGATLPANAGIPVTEAARSGRTVVRGAGPGWVAVPVPSGGALLLSVTVPPPCGDDLARLELAGRLLGPALARAVRADRLAAELAVVEATLEVGASHRTELDLAIRNQPFRGGLSGDVAEVIDVANGHWLLVGDVSGRGGSAAVPAVRVRAAFCALAPDATSPSQLLGALERSLACGDEDFVTAIVIHLSGTSLRIASAGHPPPLVVSGGSAEPVEVTPGSPLGMGLDGGAGASETAVEVEPGARLVVHTDGLLDRGESEVDLPALLSGVPDGISARELADLVITGCDAVGGRDDDVTLVVVAL